MESQDVERRLTTVLAADVVGYSRLMGEDEAGTHLALKDHRAELIDPKAAQYNGHTIKLTGDGALMEFPSVVEAVGFAVEVQLAMRKRNAELPEARQILWRIGINIGDVIVEQDDIYGDGVNVAARLEALAEPGGICVARNVFNQVKAKLDLSFEHLGEKAVKNIAEPLTVYRVVLNDKAATLATPVVQQAAKPNRRRWLVAAAAAALLLVAGGVLWWQPWAPDVKPVSPEQMALPLPDRPSIAVLPFDNFSRDPDRDYFVDGITDAIITDLSRFRDLFVIARNSTFTYKDKPVKVQEVARELGVRYVLEGSVQMLENRVRVNAQLIDATTGHHLWAERYEGDLSEIFDLQDEVTQKIVGALATSYGGRLAKAWRELSERKSEKNLEAYDYFLRGEVHFEGLTQDGIVRARKLFEKAIEIDPNFAKAYAKLAFSYLQEVVDLWSESPTDATRRALEFAGTAIRIDDAEPWGYWALAAAQFYLKGEYDQGLVEFGRALELNPNDADILADFAWALSFAGKSKEAIQRIEQAIRLNPRYPPWYLFSLGIVHYGARNYEEAIVALERIPEPTTTSRLYLAASYGQLGSQREASKEAKEILKVLPDLTVESVRFIAPYKNPEDFEHLLEGLRKSSLQL